MLLSGSSRRAMCCFGVFLATLTNAYYPTKQLYCYKIKCLITCQKCLTDTVYRQKSGSNLLLGLGDLITTVPYDCTSY